MNKPVVHYVDPIVIQVGLSAIIKPIDHPNHLPGHSVSNTEHVSTSTVQSIEEDGTTFETKNTIYKLKGVE